jgi:hypothetical protein
MGGKPQPQRRRGYAKAGLLVFGVGLLVGLAEIAFEVDALQRPAAALMALGLCVIPAGMLIDWRRATRKPMAPPPRRRTAKPRRAAVQLLIDKGSTKARRGGARKPSARVKEST